jgi:hypothetical protein
VNIRGSTSTESIFIKFFSDISPPSCLPPLASGQGQTGKIFLNCISFLSNCKKKNYAHLSGGLYYKKNIQYVVFPLDNLELFGIFRLRRVIAELKRALRLFFKSEKGCLSDKNGMGAP